MDRERHGERLVLGAEGVSTAIVKKIRAHAPGKITQLRTRYKADKATLPMPASLYSTDKDVLSIEAYPTIICTTVDTTGRIGNRQLSSDGEVDEYQYKYRMRIFVYVTGTDHADTDLLRKRFVLAVKEILLTNLILVDGDGQYALMEPNSIKESYSDVGANEAKQLLAGAYLEFEVTTSESLDAYPLSYPGEVQIECDVDVMPAGINVEVDVIP